MQDLAAKRVYGDRAGANRLLVAAASGLIAVAVSDGRVGEFGLVRNCTPIDLAAVADRDGGFLVATERDVLSAARWDVEALEPTGFGSATAVTFHDNGPLAAGPAGRLASYDESEWTDLGELPAPATDMQGDLIGTADGVVRLIDGSLRPAGLADVTSVARAAGMPLVATATGLYELGNGWLDVLDGAFELVTAAPDGRAHVAGETEFFARRQGAWVPVELPADSPIGAVAYGSRPFVLTTDGHLYIESEAGWSGTPLGIDGIVGAVVL